MNYPLISSICPTTGARRDFLLRAIAMWMKQDYPNRELILVNDDTQDTLVDLIPDIPGVEYIFIDKRFTKRPLSIGVKRNIACSLARGDIFCLLDDDDRFGSHRLSIQARPILSGLADCTALKMERAYDLPSGEMWACPDAVHAKLFPLGVRCGTLMFNARYWKSGLTYPNASQGEDVHFLRTLIAHQARLEPVRDPGYICIRHGSNVSARLEYAEWSRVAPLDYLTVEEQAFYATFKEDVQHAA